MVDKGAEATLPEKYSKVVLLRTPEMGRSERIRRAEHELVFAEDLLDLALSQVEILKPDREVDSHVLALLLDADEKICRAYCRLLGIAVSGESS